MFLRFWWGDEGFVSVQSKSHQTCLSWLWQSSLGVEKADGTAAIWRAVCDCSLDLVLIKMGEMARDVASKEGSACQD